MRGKAVSVASVLWILAVAATARGGDDDAKREEAMKKLEQAKIQACQGTQKYLAAQAKHCPAEADEAKGITCTAATAPRMQELMVACTEKLKAPPAPKPPEAKAGDEDKNKCRALDDGGAVIAELSDPSFVTCMKRLKEEVAKLKCGGGVKKVAYRFQRASGKPIAATAYCP